MPIRWSALKVNEALDVVQQQLNLAESFLADAEAKALEVTRIPGIPQYMHERAARLHQVIQDSRHRPRNALRMAREAIPEGTVEAEKARGRQHELQL